MPTATTAPNRRLAWTVAIAGLLIGWLAVRIFDARDQLWHYGVDHTAAGAAACWLAVATAVGYLGLAVLTARRAGHLQAIALVLPVPVAISALYALALGIDNDDKIGFPAGSLMFSALISMAIAVITAVRVVADARQQ